MLRIIYALVAVALLVFGVSGCSGLQGTEGTEGDVVGIVTEVTGDLTEIESFVVLDTSGDSHKFTPRDGMTVTGSPASLSEVRSQKSERFAFRSQKSEVRASESESRSVRRVELLSLRRPVNHFHVDQGVNLGCGWPCKDV